MTTTAPETTGDQPAGAVPRCPRHHNPLHDWDGATGLCRRYSPAGHSVSDPVWSEPTDNHQRGGPGRGFGKGPSSARGRGFAATHGPERVVRFRPEQETYLARLIVKGRSRSAVVGELVGRGLVEHTAGAELPPDPGKPAVAGQTKRSVQLVVADDAALERLRVTLGVERGALFRQLVDLGITARRRSRR